MVGLDLEGLSQNDSMINQQDQVPVPIPDSLQVGFQGFI